MPSWQKVLHGWRAFNSKEKTSELIRRRPERVLPAESIHKLSEAFREEDQCWIRCQVQSSNFNSLTASSDSVLLHNSARAPLRIWHVEHLQSEYTVQVLSTGRHREQRHQGRCVSEREAWEAYRNLPLWGGQGKWVSWVPGPGRKSFYFCHTWVILDHNFSI